MNRRDLIQMGSFTGLGALIPGYNQRGPNPPENRVKMFLIDPVDILSLFYGPHDCVSVRIGSPKAPADAKVVGIDFDFARRCFRLLVTSNEFDVVPLGEQTPIAEGFYSLSRECLRRQKDGSYAG